MFGILGWGSLGSKIRISPGLGSSKSSSYSIFLPIILPKLTVGTLGLGLSGYKRRLSPGTSPYSFTILSINPLSCILFISNPGSSLSIPL